MAIKKRPLKNGKVSYWISFYEGSVQRHEHAGYDERSAKALEKTRRREVKAGTYSREVKGRVLVKSWLDYYFTKRKNRTLANDRALIRDHVLTQEWFATMAIQDVRPKDMLRLVECMKSTGRLGEKSVSTVYGVVCGAFRRALFEEVIAQDVTVLPKNTLRRHTASSNQRKPYTRAEVHQIMSCEKVPLGYRMWIAIAFYTGMREGEVCGRRWRDWIRDPLPLSCLHVHSQYNDKPLKGDEHEDTRPRMVPVHPELEELLRVWWSDGFELVHLRKPTVDDFIVPTASFLNHTKSSAYKAFRRALATADVENRTLHSTRHTFISIARSNGAPKDVLERVTHNARGETIDTYTEFEWRPLCEAVARLDFDLDPLAARSILSTDSGSRAWTLSRDPKRQLSESTGNDAQPEATGQTAKTAISPKSDVCLDARQRKLLKLSEVDPKAAGPGLALCEGVAAALSGDAEGQAAALRKAADALGHTARDAR
jgi:integrase